MTTKTAAAAKITKEWKAAYDGLDYVMDQFPHVGQGFRLPRTISTAELVAHSIASIPEIGSWYTTRPLFMRTVE